jgi:tetratricopeptide (TPR) repeat protein
MATALAAGSVRAAEPRPARPEADLGRKRSVAPDTSLEGSIQAGKPKAEPGGPTLGIDSFRKKVEIQVSEKRREEIASLQKLIQLGGGAEEMPGWYFRLAELLWEEAQYYFFQSGRADDRIIAAGKDAALVQRLRAEKAENDERSRRHQDQAIALYKAVVAKYPRFPRMDEVLYFLGETLTKRDRFDEDGLKAYRALIKRFPQSRFVPDAWMAFGEYYFERANKGDRTGNLHRALEAYRNAASDQTSAVYGYAKYKQAWVHYNLGQWSEALELFREVIFFGEMPTSTVPADRKLALVREARKDYVRTYSHVGSAEGALEEFRRVGGENGWWDMLKSLAGIYFDEGKDRDAIVIYARLIRERPVSPEAPFFQSHIVTSAARLGNKGAAVQQAHVFVKLLKDIEASSGNDEKTRKALGDARRDAENTLRTLSVQYHNEWKKTRDEPVAGYAAAVYQDYLDVFPDSKTAYEMRFFYAELVYALGDFEKAGAEYEKVALQDVKALETKAGPGQEARKPGKFFKDALENTVFAYDLVAKKLDEGEKRQPSDPRKKLAMAPARLKLVEACERYLRWQPKGDRWVEIAYKAANIYYRHNDFGRASDLFTRIALDHPDHELSGYSANLVLDAYNLLGDWRNVNGWAKRFYRNEALVRVHPGLKDDLAKVIEQSAFKVIEEYERARDHEAAADAYLAFAKDWPASKLAPTALYNASVDLGRAHRLDRAIQVREALQERFPDDALAAKCLYENAEAFEAIAEFEKSADAYERYFAGWLRGKGPGAPVRHPKAKKGGRAVAAARAAPVAAGAYEEKKAQDGIINAAVFRAGLRQWAKAEAASRAYLETWPNGADASRITLSLADLYAKQGETRKELEQLAEYQARYAKDPDEWLGIQQRVADSYEKAGKRAEAARAYEAGLAYSRRQKGVKERGMALVAEAMYRELEPLYADYAKLDFNVRPKDIKFQLERKKKKLAEVQQRYAAVVKLKQAQPAVCALYKIALAASNFAQSLLQAPVPKEIRSKTEFVEEYKAQLSQAAEPFQNDAAQGAELALQAARDYGVSGDCARRAEQVLAKYKPDAVTGSLEAMPDIRVAAPADRPRGYGLLAAVEAAPAPRAAPARRDEKPLVPLRGTPAAGRAAPEREPSAAEEPGRPAAEDAPPPRSRKGGDDEDLLP